MPNRMVLIEVDVPAWFDAHCSIEARITSPSGATHVTYARASQPALAQGDEAALIDSMCMTWRHDFGLDKLHGGVCAGMDDAQRDGLRSQMRQLLNHHAGAIAALSAQREQPKCRTCNDVGMVGGLLPGDGGYQSDPCPDCAEQPQGVVVPNGYALVPIDPTAEMIEAGRWEDGVATARSVWKQMVAAALLGQREG